MIPPAGPPLYAAVEASLAGEIARGAWPSGARLPAEEALMARFGVSRTTLRHAVQNLAARGLIEVRHGIGTFVAPPRLTQELTELTGFVEDMTALGRVATARLIDHAEVAADAAVARALALPQGTTVTRIRRVRLADGVALSYDVTWLPTEIGARIVRHDLAAEPIFRLLEQRYGMALIDAEYCLEAAAADAATAAALAVAEGSPIMRIERTTRTTGGRPVDHEVLHYRGDLIRFATRLARRRPAAG